MQLTRNEQNALRIATILAPIAIALHLGFSVGDMLALLTSILTGLFWLAYAVLSLLCLIVFTGLGIAVLVAGLCAIAMGIGSFFVEEWQ